MFRPASRSLLRSAQSSLAPPRTTLPGSRRFLSTDPPHLKRRSFKNSAARWAVAIGGIYWYNTSPLFADQPQHNLLNPNVSTLEDTNLPTLDSLPTSQKQRIPTTPESALESTFAQTSAENASMTLDAPSSVPLQNSSALLSSSPMELEDEAEAEGAFNPITGEINWDCPCLGGMAHGPCGEEFKAAFSCFVYSTDEPKGMNCVDKFQDMQTCFRAHPEVYKGELEDDEMDEELDEGLRAEREKLAGEIKERKDAEAKRAAQEHEEPPSRGRRLLELSDPPPKPKKESKPKARPAAKVEARPDVEEIADSVKSTSQDAATEIKNRASSAADSAKDAAQSARSKASSAASSAKAKASSAATSVKDTFSPSSEPHPGMSEEHEITAQRRAVQDGTKTSEFIDPDLDAQPKPWHDARDPSRQQPPDGDEGGNLQTKTDNDNSDPKTNKKGLKKTEK